MGTPARPTKVDDATTRATLNTFFETTTKPTKMSVFFVSFVYFVVANFKRPRGLFHDVLDFCRSRQSCPSLRAWDARAWWTRCTGTRG